MQAIAYAQGHPGLPMLQEYFDEERISFLLLEERHRLPFLSKLHDLLQDEDIGGPSEKIDLNNRVHSYTPLMDIVRVPTKKMKGGRRDFYYYSLFYTDSSESTVKYINKLILEFGRWLRSDYENLGYKIVQDSQSAGGKSLRRSRYRQNEQGGKEKVYSIALHIFLPWYLDTTVKAEMIAKLHVPVSIRPAVHVHTDDSADALYTKVARSHLLLPSHPYEYPASNASASVPFDPAIPIAVASRLRVMVPHSLEAAYSSFLTIPALIGYPDEPNALLPRDRAMPLFEAVKMVQDELVPRRHMANASRPWTRVDKEPFWHEIQRKIVVQNIHAFTKMLNL
ncbi:hypothetical protein P389DRAFT_45561 [Cystobasidium minutum MCA 4210]|uniref:uncharacterized protein n=1 Tax=Cystobasidium minutum MCA 4210 TaxID=1397322 RepID=UPI0034D00A75|eukprot:jgi/Rhomi1/45561/CE45560_100